MGKEEVTAGLLSTSGGDIREKGRRKLSQRADVSPS